MAAPGRPAGLSTSARALLAVALLAGFYLLAAAIVVGLVAFDVTLFLETGHADLYMGKLFVLSAVVVWTVLRVVFLTRRPRATGPEGLLVTREQQPELWTAVDRIAEQTGVRGPAEIRLIPEVNAGVWEETKLLGLIPGKRHLVIGVPLFIGLTEAELDSVLAHEFGHYSNQDVRLAGVAVSGRIAILHTISAFHHQAGQHRTRQSAEIAAKNAKRAAKGRNPTGGTAHGGVGQVLAAVFSQYAKLYFRVSEAVSRRQEYAADQTAARIAGRDATASALRRLPALDSAHGFYLDRYATLGWEQGLLPPPGQVYGGLAHLLADPKRRRELTDLGLPDETPDPYDSHPPIAQRVAAIESLPDDGRSAEGSRPAVDLLRDADRALAELEVITLIPEAATKRRVEWPELVHEACLAGARKDAQPVLRALQDSGLPCNVKGLLDTVDAGRGWEVAALLPQSEQAAAASGRAAREFRRPILRSALAALTVLALARSGQARWELSWSAPAELRLPDNIADRLEAALDAAVTDTPDTAPLRALFTHTGV